jgi:hypothetical protein
MKGEYDLQKKIVQPKTIKVKTIIFFLNGRQPKFY